MNEKKISKQSEWIHIEFPLFVASNLSAFFVGSIIGYFYNKRKL